MLPSTVERHERTMAHNEAQRKRQRLWFTIGVSSLVFAAVVGPAVYSIFSTDGDELGDVGSGSGSGGF